MQKKIISILLSVALLFTVALGTAVNSSALTTGTAVGEQVVITDNFKPTVLSGANAVLSSGMTSIWANESGIGKISAQYTWGSGSAKNALTLEGAADAAENANAYGGAGSSFKSVYTPGDWWVKPSGGAAANYAGFRVNQWFTISAANLEKSGFAFWVKAEEPMKIFMKLIPGSDSSAELTSAEINVPAGTSVVEIPIGNFTIDKNNVVTDTGLQMQQIRIFYKRLDGKTDNGTAYFDSIGYYNNLPQRGLSHRSKAVTVADFDSLTTLPSNYKSQSSDGATTIALESAAAAESLPLTVTSLWDFEDGIEEFVVKSWHRGTVSQETAAENVYGGVGGSLKFEWVDENNSNPPTIRRDREWNPKTGDGLAFWVKAEQAETLEVSFHTDWANNIMKKSVNISAGENIVMIPWDSFEGVYNTNRIVYFAIEAKTNKSGVLYFDNFMSYAETDESANPNAYGLGGQSIHAYYEKGNVGWKQLQLNGLEIPLTENGNKWGEDAVISVWIKASRATKFNLQAWDSGKWYTATVPSWTTSKTYSVPAGESILRIPVTDFDTAAVAGEEKWDFLDSLRFNFVWMEDNSPLDFYVDDVAVEYPIIGDANDDEAINIKDLVRLKKLFAASEQPTLIKALDVNASGVFDADDIVSFAKYLLGVEALATSPYVAPVPEDGSVAVTALNSWGYDS